MKRLPVVFVSHGAPNLVLDKGDQTAVFLTNFSKNVLQDHRPKAILCISAHWEENDFTITTSPTLDTIHDFGGFEQELYRIKYPAPTSRDLIDRVKTLFGDHLVTLKEDSKRGLDHGAWSPLKLMYPNADVPVVQLSLKRGLDAKTHYQVGKILKPLAEEGYLVFASGGSVHNLRALFDPSMTRDPTWATDFDRWLTHTIINSGTGDQRMQALVNFKDHPTSKLAHPREEHLIPIMVACGAGDHLTATQIHSQWKTPSYQCPYSPLKIINRLTMAPKSFQYTALKAPDRVLSSMLANVMRLRIDCLRSVQDHLDLMPLLEHLTLGQAHAANYMSLVSACPHLATLVILECDNNIQLKDYLFTQTSLTCLVIKSSRVLDKYLSALLVEKPSIKRLGNPWSQVPIIIYGPTPDILRVRIYDPKNKRWEVPLVNQMDLPTEMPSLVNYNIRFSNTSSSFGFVIERLDGTVLFDTTTPDDCSTNGLIFSDTYLEMTTSFATENPNLYGLGERTTNLRLNNSATYTLFNRDWGTASTPDINLYGSHPFYLQLESTGAAHGVFLLNSNAMDVALQPQSLTYKVVGGILDMFFFVGPTPSQVIQQYTQIIGTPHLPPYWGLGWHQCRYGYHSLNETQTVVQNYVDHSIPLETMWNDIDYMDAYKDFTLDPVRFDPTEMAEFIDYLHSKNQHYIMIVDPGIAIEKGYDAYDQLIASNAFVTEADYKTPAEGEVWPGLTYFPDFFHPNASAYWLTQLANFRQMVEYDGVWIDMNEVSNQCNGDCATAFDPNNPPYLPGGVPLDESTLNMTSTQYPNLSIYNTHNLYGFTESMATSNAVEKITNKRSLIITRSTFAGSGKYAGTWLGDNHSTYEDMAYSIPGMLAMNMFGVPLVGSDICGFNGNTSYDLCARWIQLGNFYPFSRNHNGLGSLPQEPYVFGQKFAIIAINAINLKYTLLPYYYTLFFLAHMNGDTVVRPLFFEYPTDVNTYTIDAQFMVGPSLLVTPVLRDGALNVSAYFPVDTWYDYYNGEEISGSITGDYSELAAPLETINLHIRGGSIIPTQPTYQTVISNCIPITTTVARTLPFEIIVALDQVS
eukprot:gene16679-19821_t